MNCRTLEHPTEHLPLLSLHVTILAIYLSLFGAFQIRALQDEMTEQDHLIAKLGDDRKVQEEINRELSDKLSSEIGRSERLSDAKTKLEATLDETERTVESERRAKTELERGRKKIEQELKLSHETVDELKAQKHDLEDALRRSVRFARVRG